MCESMLVQEGVDFGLDPAAMRFNVVCIHHAPCPAGARTVILSLSVRDQGLCGVDVELEFGRVLAVR